MNTPYRKARLAIAASLSAALSATLSACGGSTSAVSAPASSPAAVSSAPSASPSPVDPLAGLTGDQITRKTLDDLKAATSYHFQGSGTDSGAPLHFDVTTEPGKTCTSTMEMGAKGSLKVILIGPAIWIDGNRTFWGASGVSPATVTKLSGKWVKSTSTGKMASFAALCDIGSKMASQLGKDTMRRGASTIVNGQAVVQVTDTKDGSSAYISDTATPLLVRTVGGAKDSGSTDFSDYNAPVSVTPPPASETLDGKQFGL